MIIATFGPTTAWVGKAIRFDDGRFSLEDLGQIQASAVVDYDRQGHLQWAYDGLREWVYQTAGEPAPAPATPPAVQAAPVVTQPEAAAAAAIEEPQTASFASAATPSIVPPAASDAAPHLVPPVAPTAAAPAADAAPAAESAPAAGVSPAAAGEPASATRKSRRVWFVLGGVVILALLIGIVLAAGRLRDGLGIAFTLVAIVFVVALLVAVLKPPARQRWLPGSASRTVPLACAGLAAVCFIFAGVLWWMPHYQVVTPTDTRIALDETPEIKVVVYNRGLLGGTYSADYAVDGAGQDDVSFPLPGGKGRELTLSLPADAQRGPVQLSLGGASVDARAVAPPAFAVAELAVDPAPAKLGDSVTLTTTVKNTGDLAGTFGGTLLVNGNELLKQPVEIGVGRSKDVTYDLTADRAGTYELSLGDAATRFVIVEPVRLANGYVVHRSVRGGRAHMTIENKTGADAVAVLTRAGAKGKAALAVYIRAGKKAVINGIPDGAYILWDCIGEDFNWTMRDFFTPGEHKRWLQPLKFTTTASTSAWTSRWSDSSYNYSQRHSQTTTHWTNWTVTLATGESKYSKLVSEEAFPGL